MMSCELCIVESLVEVHAFTKYCNHSDGEWIVNSKPGCIQIITKMEITMMGGSLGNSYLRYPMVQHARRVVSRALHAYELCEMSHTWLCGLCAYVNICEDVYKIVFIL